jgi:dTDP-4-amino-4,6-dideoxygalactose transaminase
LHNIVFSHDPAQLVQRLKAQGIHAVQQYRTVSQHPAYAHLSGDYPDADWWTRHAVYVPFGMAMTAEDAERVAAAVAGSGLMLTGAALRKCA